MRERLEQVMRYFANKYESYKRFRPQFFGWEFFIPEDREHINWREWPYQKVVVEENETLVIDFKKDGEETGREGEKYVLLLEMKGNSSVIFGSDIYWPDGEEYQGNDTTSTVYTYIGFICMKRNDAKVYDVIALARNLQ